MNALAQVLALLARIATAALDAALRRKRQARFDRVERDPGAEFLRRFKRPQDTGADADSGKRNN